MQLLRYKLDLSPKDMRRILVITLPAMVELVFSQLFGMVDTMMLGHIGSLSEKAIAAVGYTNNPINLLLGVMSAFNVGTTAVVAWSLGAGDVKQARQAVRTAIGLNLIMGVAATLIGVGLSVPIVQFMQAQEELIEWSSQYLSVVSMGFIAAALNMAVTSALRGAGQTRIPMVYNLAGNLLNVVGNYILIYGRFGFPALGVLGAAISTTVSRVLTALAALVVLFCVDTPVRASIRDDFRLRWSQAKQILRIGITTAAEQGIMQVGFMLFSRTVAGLGPVTFAAHQIGLNINGLSWVPSQAFGVAATTLVGQSLGAGEQQQARDYAKFVHRMALGTSILVAVFFVLGASPIVRLYINEDSENGLYVIAMAVGVLRIMALGMPGIATQQPISAALRGAGDTWFPLIASMMGIWIFRVAVAPLFIYTLGWGLNGAWLSIVLDQTTRAVVVYIRFAKGKWMNKKIITS